MISSIGNSYGFLTTSHTRETQQTDIVSLLTSTASSADGGLSGLTGTGSDTAAISDPGKLLGDLQQLQTSDPAKFKQVTADIASKLKSAAGDGGDSFLSFLASKFDAAAKSGNVSNLLPPSGGPFAGTYDSRGQAGAPDLSSFGSSGVDLTALFASISSEVTDAIHGSKG